MLLAVGTALLLENLALFAFGEKQRGVPPVVAGVYRLGDAFLPAKPSVVGVVSIALVVAFLLFVQYTDRPRDARPGPGSRGDGADGGRRRADLGDRLRLGGALAGLGRWAAHHHFRRSMPDRHRHLDQGLHHDHDRRGRRRRGSILGAVVLGFAEAIGYALFPGSVTYLLIFPALILFLIMRPQGIMGKPRG